MSYTCIPSSGDRPSPPDDFMKAVQKPELLRGTPENPAFAVGGTGYDMLINRDVPIVWTFINPSTGEVEPQAWTYLKVAFANDLDYQTAITAEYNFTVVNQGEDTEHFSGIMPSSELNKLSMGNWYIAALIASDNTILACCPFYIIGGI